MNRKNFNWMFTHTHTHAVQRKNINYIQSRSKKMMKILQMHFMEKFIYRTMKASNI